MTIKLTAQTVKPVEHAPEAQRGSLNAKPPPFRVLIVEDLEPLAEVMRCTLEFIGCQVRIAHTKSAGLQLLSAPGERPDLVLLDSDLPDGNGLSLCAWLRQQPVLGNVPVMLCTGRVTPEIEAKATALSVEILFKPFSMEALVGLIERHRQQQRRETPPETAPR